MEQHDNNKPLQADNPAYSLIVEEMQAVRAFIEYQHRYGINTQVALPDADGYIDRLFDVAAQSGNLRNSTAKAWMEAFYGELLKASSFEKMLVVNRYGRFCWQNPEPDDILWRFSDKWVSFWDAFTHGWRWRDSGDFDNWHGPAYPHVQAPAVWKTKADDLWKTWENSPSSDLVDVGTGGMESHAKYSSAERQIFTTWWQNQAATIATNHKKLWAEQLATAKTMVNANSLTGSDYLFFVHLFLALPTGGADAQALAVKLAGRSTSTKAYPEGAKFITHLVYGVLLVLADANGKYKWNNAWLRSFVRDFRTCIDNGTHEVTKTLKEVLTQFAAKLDAGDGFPYAGKPDFNRRLSDTLGALDEMRLE